MPRLGLEVPNYQTSYTVTVNTSFLKPRIPLILVFKYWGFFYEIGIMIKKIMLYLLYTEQIWHADERRRTAFILFRTLCTRLLLRRGQGDLHDLCHRTCQLVFSQQSSITQQGAWLENEKQKWTKPKLNWRSQSSITDWGNVSCNRKATGNKSGWSNSRLMLPFQNRLVTLSKQF